MSAALDEALSRFAPTAPHVGAHAFAAATALLCAGRPAEAAPLFQTSLQHPGPHQLRAVYGLGVAWTRLGQLGPAEMAFRRLLSHTDALLSPSIQLGLLLIAQGRYAEALEIHEAAIARHVGHPDLARVIADAATAYDHLGLYSEGVHLCRRAIDELGVHEPLIWRNLGVLHLRLDESEPARAALRVAWTLAPWLRDELSDLWSRWGGGGAL